MCLVIEIRYTCVLFTKERDKVKRKRERGEEERGRGENKNISDFFIY